MQSTTVSYALFMLISLAYTCYADPVPSTTGLHVSSNMTANPVPCNDSDEDCLNGKEQCEYDKKNIDRELKRHNSSDSFVDELDIDRNFLTSNTCPIEEKCDYVNKIVDVLIRVNWYWCRRLLVPTCKQIVRELGYWIDVKNEICPNDSLHYWCEENMQLIDELEARRVSHLRNIVGYQYIEPMLKTCTETERCEYATKVFDKVKTFECAPDNGYCKMTWEGHLDNLEHFKKRSCQETTVNEQCEHDKKNIDRTLQSYYFGDDLEIARNFFTSNTCPIEEKCDYVTKIMDKLIWYKWCTRVFSSSCKQELRELGHWMEVKNEVCLNDNLHYWCEENMELIDELQVERVADLRNMVEYQYIEPMLKTCNETERCEYVTKVFDKVKIFECAPDNDYCKEHWKEHLDNLERFKKRSCQEYKKKLL